MKRNLSFFFLLLSFSAYCQQKSLEQIESTFYHFSLQSSIKGDSVAAKKEIPPSSSFPFGFGPYLVSTLDPGPPKVCSYYIMMDGVSPGGIAQFSIDGGTTWLNANVSNYEVMFALYAAPTTQEFWARDSNNPSYVITTHIPVCKK